MTGFGESVESAHKCYSEFRVKYENYGLRQKECLRAMERLIPSDIEHVTY